MKGQGLGWRGESRRHSLARKGVSTNIDQRYMSSGMPLGAIVRDPRHTTLHNFLMYPKNKEIVDITRHYQKSFGKSPSRVFYSSIGWDHPEDKLGNKWIVLTVYNRNKYPIEVLTRYNMPIILRRSRIDSLFEGIEGINYEISRTGSMLSPIVAELNIEILADTPEELLQKKAEIDKRIKGEFWYKR